jgi:MFS family permease
VGYLWLSQISATDSYFGAVFGPVLIAGLATGFIFMPITTTVLGGVEPEHAGSASGLLQTTQQLGSAVGVAAIVSIYASGAVPGQFVPGAEAAFLTSGAFSLAAFLVAAVGLRAPRPPEPVAEELEPELAEVA